jgi:hypothetical protein
MKKEICILMDEFFDNASLPGGFTGAFITDS